MGTRINALFDHELADPGDRGSALAQLAAALPAVLAVRDYLRTADSGSTHTDLPAWRADVASPLEPRLFHYTGPGSLFLSVTARAARVRTGGRWRGFLTIDPLRRVHLAAFRGIAAALGAGCLAVYADSCQVDDLFWAKRSPRECVD